VVCTIYSTDFMGQYEVGQKELVDIHNYTFMIDHCSLQHADSDLVSRVHGVNQLLLKHIFVVSFLPKTTQILKLEFRIFQIIDSSLIMLPFPYCIPFNPDHFCIDYG
jgi:hypothetical protein